VLIISIIMIIQCRQNYFLLQTLESSSIKDLLKVCELLESFVSCDVHLLLTVGSNSYNENETIAKFEIMDGAPVRGTYTFCLLALCVEWVTKPDSLALI